MLSVSFVSCGSDDDDESIKDEYEKTENLSNQDPEGTIVLNMVSGAKDNYYTIGELGEIHIDAANNFMGLNRSFNEIYFVTIGKVDGLSKIDRIPEIGWGKSVAVIPETGYMAYTIYNGYRKTYARIFVVDYYKGEQGNTTGAIIKYQVPFELPIKLDVTSLTFNKQESDYKTIKLINPTSFEIKESPYWCHVTIIDNVIRISVYENTTSDERQGEIILKNSINTMKISVYQKGV